VALKTRIVAHYSRVVLVENSSSCMPAAANSIFQTPAYKGIRALIMPVRLTGALISHDPAARSFRRHIRPIENGFWYVGMHGQ
jgi:hypothetical protein